MGFGAVKSLVSNYKPVTATGPTYDDYIDALDLDLRGWGNATIIINNTHASNSLKYKVLVRVEYDDGIDYTEIPETTLAAGADPNREIIQRAYARAKLQVKSTVAGTPASWKVDAIRMPEQ